MAEIQKSEKPTPKAEYKSNQKKNAEEQEIQYTNKKNVILGHATYAA